MAHLYNEETISQAIDTKWAGKTVHFAKETDSTNSWIKRLAKDGAEHGTLAVAEFQSAGRGRFDRRWEAPEGSSIMMTLLLRPEFSPQYASMLTLVMGMAVAQAAEELGFNVSIKWPNDIVISKKKICGILTEMGTNGVKINYVLIGVGINVNLKEFPEEMQDKATSLILEGGHEYDRNQVIALVMKYFEINYEKFILFVSGFLLKPANEADVRNVLENLRYPAEDVPAGVKVQCFGNFEVFVGGRPLSFKRSKSKELLAYLVDRNGATCTNGEMLAVLWEDKPDTASLHSHLRNLIFDLSHTLEDAGVRGLLVRGRSTLAIDTSKVECDYYNFLRGDRSTISSYRGEYMTQYSWAEVTRSALRQQAAASQKGGLPSYYVPPTGF